VAEERRKATPPGEPSPPRDAGTPGRWQAGWEDQRRFQMARALEATPAERLAWLEQAIELAYRTGALPRPTGGPK